MASRKPSGRPRRPDSRPTDTPAPRPANPPAGAAGGAKRSSGQIARQRAAVAGAGFVALLAVVGIGSYLGRDKSDNTDVIAGAIVAPVDQTPTTVTTVAPPTTAAPPLADTTSPALIVDTTAPVSTIDPACPAADGTSPRTTKFGAAPPMCIDPTKPYTATVRTSKGTLIFDLDPAAAPNTVNNFVVLSRFHFYDGLTFHVVVPDYIAQGGDPLGTGEGDAGYRFADELPTSGKYAIGDLVSANVEGEADSNGSQFFVILGKTGTDLPLKYTRFGHVSGDFETTFKALARVGSATGKPKEDVTIQAVTISEVENASVAGGTTPDTTLGAGAPSDTLLGVDTTAASATTSLAP